MFFNAFLQGALSAFAEFDLELQYSMPYSTKSSGLLMRFILFGDRVEIAQGLFQTKRCRIGHAFTLSL